MDFEQTIHAALSDLPCPVSKPPAGGNHETYVTFQEVLGSFTAYASNAPMRLNHLLQVSVFSRRDDGTHRTVMTRAISLLRAAGVRVYSYGPDDFEKDTGYHHIAVTCEWDERT